MPTLVWTLFYIAVKYCDGDVTIGGICKSLFSMPFSAQGAWCVVVYVHIDGFVCYYAHTACVVEECLGA